MCIRDRYTWRLGSKRTGSRPAGAGPRARPGHSALDAHDEPDQTSGRRRGWISELDDTRMRRHCEGGRMLAIRRPLPVIVLAALFAGCGVAPTPLVSPTPTGAPTAGAATPGVATPQP